MSELATVPVTALKGVGAALAEKLARVGLETLQDVLFHLPLRYQDRTRVVPIGALRPGQDAVPRATLPLGWAAPGGEEPAQGARSRPCRSTMKSKDSS